MASEAKAPPPAHVAKDASPPASEPKPTTARDAPAAKGPPPSHVAQDAPATPQVKFARDVAPAEAKAPPPAHVAQDAATPRQPRRPHADTPAAGAVAKAAAEALLAAPDISSPPRPAGTGSPRATAALRAAASGLRAKERGENAGEALRAAAAEAVAGETAAPGLRASAEEVTDAARASNLRMVRITLGKMVLRVGEHRHKTLRGAY